MITFDGRMQARVGEHLAAWLIDRAARYGAVSADQQGRDDLELLRDLFAVELVHVGVWTLPELRYLVEATSKDHLRARVGHTGVLYVAAYELGKLSLGNGEQPVGRSLLTRLSSLTPAQDLTVADALSRWRHQGLPATASGFQAVGLRVKDE